MTLPAGPVVDLLVEARRERLGQQADDLPRRPQAEPVGVRRRGVRLGQFRVLAIRQIHRVQAAHDLIDDLGILIGRRPLHERTPWPGTASASAPVAAWSRRIPCDRVIHPLLDLIQHFRARRFAHRRVGRRHPLLLLRRRHECPVRVRVHPIQPARLGRHRLLVLVPSSCRSPRSARCRESPAALRPCPASSPTAAARCCRRTGRCRTGPRCRCPANRRRPGGGSRSACPRRRARVGRRSRPTPTAGR